MSIYKWIQSVYAFNNSQSTAPKTSVPRTIVNMAAFAMQLTHMFLTPQNMPPAIVPLMCCDFYTADCMASEAIHRHHATGRAYFANYTIIGISKLMRNENNAAYEILMDCYTRSRYHVPSNDPIMIVLMTLLYRIASEFAMAGDYRPALYLTDLVLDGAAAWNAIEPTSHLKWYIMLLQIKCNQRLKQWDTSRQIVQNLYASLSPDCCQALRLMALRRMMLQYSHDRNATEMRKVVQEATITSYMVLNSPTAEDTKKLAHKTLARLSVWPSDSNNERKRKTPYGDLDDGTWVEIDLEGDDDQMV